MSEKSRFFPFTGGWRGVRVTLAALLGVLAIAVSLQHLLGATQGLRVLHQYAGAVPVTLYLPRGGKPAPTVVIAHGFAGSRVLMKSFAITLARNGYVAVTFDFPGHGRNRTPFVADLEKRRERLQVLGAALDGAIGVARTQPVFDGRLALLGHSMAGDVLIDYTERHPDRISALALLSPYLAEDQAIARLPDLLLLYGALESGTLHQQGLDLVAKSVGHEARPGVTYGEFGDGSAIRMVLIGGVEHIGELFSAQSLRESLAWFDQVFGHADSGVLDLRAGWLGMLFAGVILLAWSLAHFLPRVVESPRGAGLPWKPFWVVALAPAILTPLILWRVPSSFLPILLGDYLALHFGVYGLVTLAALWIVGRRRPQTSLRGLWRGVPGRRFLIAVTAVALFMTVAIAWPLNEFVTTFVPGIARWPLVAAILPGTLLYFLADEWATRGENAARGAYAATKALFLLSLVLAIALRLYELFFLVIILPAILLFFLLYGMTSGWIMRSTGHPAVAACANALAFACAIAVIFPVVSA